MTEGKAPIERTQVRSGAGLRAQNASTQELVLLRCGGSCLGSSSWEAYEEKERFKANSGGIRNGGGVVVVVRDPWNVPASQPSILGELEANKRRCH